MASDELIERLVQYAAFTPLANATGAPAISLPFGSSDEGLPIAVQLWAAHGDERTLLELAFEIEQDDPIGVYKIHTTVRDLIGKRSVALVQELTVAPSLPK